jgi:hypothetical protein
MRGAANHEEELEMIQHYPNATQVSDLQGPDPPAAVLQAVRVIYAGAGREKLARYAFGVGDKVSDVTIRERTVNGQPAWWFSKAARSSRCSRSP